MKLWNKVSGRILPIGASEGQIGKTPNARLSKEAKGKMLNQFIIKVKKFLHQTSNIKHQTSNI